MNNDRLLNILRWVVTPIVLAIIAGYFQMRTSANKEQTRAAYDTLAPNVLQLQEQVATLTGRIEELSRRQVLIPPCPEDSKASKKPTARVEAPPAKSSKSLTLEELLGSGQTELMMDKASKASNTEVPAKVPAKFEDMIQQQKK